MFYDESAINELLLCKVCDSKLTAPVILPCGKSICLSCVNTLTDNNLKRIKCQFCAKTHNIPRDGFPENETIIELIKLKASKISECQRIAEIKSILNTIDEQRLKIESSLEIGETTIREKCDRARNSAQIAAEEASLRIEKYHKNFLDQIDEHEKEYQKHLKSLKSNKTEDMDRVLDEVKQFQTKFTLFLKQNDFTDENLAFMI